jgi:hypothetical protein
LAEPLIEAPYFFEPLGVKKIMGTLNICINHAGRISYASSQYTHAIHHSCFEIKPRRNNFDYIYLTKDLIELKGRKYDGKRNHLKRFQNKYPDYEFLPIGNRNKKEALEIFNKWFKSKKDNAKPTIATSGLAYRIEYDALNNALSYFEDLELSGGGIFIDGNLRGFFLGNKLHKNMAVGQFMYSDPDIKSIYQVLQWEGCRKLFNDYKYINMEDDLGLPGLRRSKLSYHPVRLEEKFDIQFQK